MSTYYISSPMTLAELTEAAAMIGWTPTKDTDGQFALTDGRNFCHGLDEFTAADGAKRVHFEKYGGNDVSDIVDAADAICEHDERYEGLLDDAAMEQLGMVEIAF